MRNSSTGSYYKERKDFAARKTECETLKAKYENKIPVIIERYNKERHLNLMEKTKFLVPGDLYVSKLLMIIRDKVRVNENQAIYLVADNKTILTMTKTMAEVYQEHKDEDGFVYITYASQSVFGANSA
uniref:Autophagy-related protein n=1 Tax=Tetranychus urticae TaxID=32264 RepID=T1KZB4_TETUR